MKTTIKKHYSLLLGVGLFVAGFFSFSHSTYSGGYFYDDLPLFLLVIGSVFITIGLLKIKEKEEAKTS